MFESVKFWSIRYVIWWTTCTVSCFLLRPNECLNLKEKKNNKKNTKTLIHHVQTTFRRSMVEDVNSKVTQEFH